MPERLKQHAQPFVRTNEAKKEVSHVFFRNAQLPASFFGGGAFGEVLVKRMEQGLGVHAWSLVHRAAQRDHVVAGLRNLLVSAASHALPS